MKIIVLLLSICLTLSIEAHFKSTQSENTDLKDQNPHSINVSFNMGNTQEIPTSNAATSSQQLRFEHIHKSELLKEESFLTRMKNRFMDGVATAAGSAITWQIIDLIKKYLQKARYDIYITTT